ncbi:MAG: glycosyltransferase family 4 protein [Nitrospiraceae bacterium]|nr:glycosyltransferase family 4 protein [Nitrospiraceae bacterium]
MIKILHLSPTYLPVFGGAELHMKELSEGLVSRGHEVTVLTANVRNSSELYRGIHGGLADKEIINGVRVVRFDPGGGVLGAGLRRLLKFPGGWRSLRTIFGEDGMEMLGAYPQMIQVIPYLLRARPDVVMAMNWYWAPVYYAYLAKQLRSFPLIGIPQFHTAEQWCSRKVYDRLLSSATAVIANTAHEAQFMREHGAGRVEVGGVGIDPETFMSRDGAAIRARYGIGQAPVVGFVGRQGVNKGILQLLDAMKIVWRWNPDVRLLIAGHRSADQQDRAVQVALDHLTATERARLIQISQFEDADKPSIYDALDVFALPSIGESFGLAYLEAWLCKKPVIGARIPSTECVIEEGVDGLLVDHTRPEQLAECIIELLSDRGKAEKMGIAGYNKTTRRYTWTTLIDQLETLYGEVAEIPGGRCGGKARAV